MRGLGWAPQSPIAQGQVRSALPLGGERTSSSRSGSSGSAFLPFRHAQARVAVRTTLPLGIERTVLVCSGSSGSAFLPFRHAQARVAVPLTLPLDVERTETARSGPSGSANPPFWYAGGRVAVPATLPHGVERGKSVRLGPSGSENPPFWYAGGPSGSAPHTATRRRTHGLHAITLPHGVERTKTARSGPSGSADHAGLRAQGRVAVRTHRSGTLEAEWQCDMRHKRNGRCTDGFGAGRGLQSSWVRDARAGTRREGQ